MVVHYVKLLHNILELLINILYLFYRGPQFFTILRTLPLANITQYIKIAYQYFVFISLWTTILYNTTYFATGKYSVMYWSYL